jgi:hypothetical protein
LGEYLIAFERRFAMSGTITVAADVQDGVVRAFR